MLYDKLSWPSVSRCAGVRAFMTTAPAIAQTSPKPPFLNYQFGRAYDEMFEGPGVPRGTIRRYTELCWNRHQKNSARTNRPPTYPSCIRELPSPSTETGRGRNVFF